MIPQVLKILRDDYSHLKHYDMPFCTGAQPQYFELDIIDELSVSYTLGQHFFKNSDLHFIIIFSPQLEEMYLT